VPARRSTHHAAGIVATLGPRDAAAVLVHDHPDLAIRRVSALLAGHYVVSLERPSAARGEHRLTLALVGRRGTVLARSTYVD
jgi:hypothetical protein